MRSFARGGDFWSGLALAALGTFIVVQARAWDYRTEEGPGPGFFPVWYGAIMVVLSLLLVAGTALKPAAHKPVAWDEVRRAMACWLAFVASIVLMRWVGFVVAFALLTWFMAFFMAGKPHRIAVPLALAMSAVFYALFVMALDVGLPPGTLF